MTPKTETPAETGLTPLERQAIETLYRAFSEGNPDLLDEAVTEDWQDIPLNPGQQPGREGMKPLIRSFRAAFPDTTIEILEIIGAPGRAAVRAVMTGTHSGDWFGIAPTGRSFRLAIHEFHRIADGKLTHTWHLEDWFGWMNQIGARPVLTQETA
ncbi:ester cyclase [Azospirillum thiophilum]|uniref:Ester cyclase n=1 Tax=Azospirillum thiophilum TaxID=528244 RepID=A0AAC8VZX1_9PROT|nr:ester cyclase [Azospirillum thiophilum]ALG72421.1 ester cyclase [Azospirillum thiophilum]KJR61382.1 ester cyclase [Azospirillum thiophilum]